MPRAGDGSELGHDPLAQRRAPGGKERRQARVMQHFPFKCSDGKNDSFSINGPLISGIQFRGAGKGTG